jgi:IS5 family transposase
VVEMVTRNLFSGSFMDMLDLKDPLIVLADNFPWLEIETKLQQYYKNSKIGRPNKPIRLMVGLLLLKQIENLSDENVVLQFKRNPYYQYFCGLEEYTPALPCHATELVKFRNRIGKEGMEYIFQMSVHLHGNKAKESQVIVDSTVQESNITFPTDGKLAIKIIIKLLKIAKKEGIKLRRSFKKEIKDLRIQLRFFKHPKKIKKALGAMKRLKQIAMIILRDIDRKFGDNLELHNKYAKDFYLFNRVLKQTKDTPNKIYSLHELDAYAINKGKDHKGYEFGTKASIVTTKKSGIIVGVQAHKTNIHDSKTLSTVLSIAIKNVGNTTIKEAICDRGYRGIKEIILNDHTITISIPGTRLKKDTKKQIKIKQKKFRRRASIEPIIGHLKSDYRLQRNYLKGFIGDEINLLLAAAAFNLKKWMNIYFYALFIQDFTLLVSVAKQIQRLKSLYQILRVLKLYFK